MSIKEYLKTLSYDQLITAREMADNMLKEKDAEPMVTLWSVSTSHLVFKYFRTYMEAVSYLSRKAETLDRDEKDERDKAISVCRERVRESEVRDYIDG